MKRVDQVVIRNVPFFSHSRHRRQILRALGDQSFEQRREDMMFWNVGNQLRVEVLRFGAVGEVKSLPA